MNVLGGEGGREGRVWGGGGRGRKEEGRGRRINMGMEMLKVLLIGYFDCSFRRGWYFMLLVRVFRYRDYELLGGFRERLFG